ncbi:septum site-determining protein MinC [Gloeocapsopsis crepidinum LEGE 06123]|uniref:Probable septum site-determining protein MinC n=1 Tax=Gloeocapsopsis crepidinum LEGE 06123 TaxID=588587 RepID=A0ABR9UMN3_9CHRO|nr:septum site-determining protein MinC [Gloeocapsopsis crepidinum]MBE9188890.1 septum site-determining protein MinC [Gloeocapsopsis crepidinum LEGE 06123]
MTDSALPEIENAVVPPSNTVNVNLQVRLKGEGEKLLLILPTETETATATSWSDLWQQLKQRLNGGDRFWQPSTTVHLIATDRLLDAQQLQAIADALSEVQLQLTRVFTSRRQTAVAAATAGYSVEQTSVTKINQTLNATPVPLAEPLYLQMTVRSGMEIRHAGSVIVLGDLNPGGTVVANGDILVWGRLRGVAHAGAAGNSKCLIMALQMEPTQLRIAEFVARAPTNVPSQFYPEVAYVMSEGIRIAKAADFSKSQFSLPS